MRTAEPLFPKLRKRFFRLRHEAPVWGFKRGAFGARAICFGWFGVFV
jgi:hypothetical protein